MKSRGSILVWIAWALVAITVSGPAMEVFGNPLLRVIRFLHLPLSIVAPLSLLWFLDYALGKALVGILSVCVLLVLVSGDIKWWTKLSLIVATAVAWRLLFPWIERSNHLW
ncbi:MAG TPA: hypothetical protein VJX69_04245 [Terriglobales bacterium]|nr:hypothetical protein [Terriglobales bacterium]